jgi:hypothetical protein
MTTILFFFFFQPQGGPPPPSGRLPIIPGLDIVAIPGA